MNSNVTKFSRMLALAVATAFPLIMSGSMQTAAAQKYSHRPRASAFTQQGSTNAAATAVFDGGRDLIDDAQWAKAEEAFAQYISKYPQEKNVDAALYWMAYSQAKLRKFKQSKDTIDKLLKTYEKTTWKEDAELLLAQLPSAPVAVKIDPTNVTVEPVIVAVPVKVPAPVMVPPQDPVEVKIRTQEMQERMAEAQARAQERMQEAQERMAERMAAAASKMKDKDFKYDFDFNFDDFDYSVGKGVGQGKGAGSDDPNEFKIVVLQALCESDPQRCVAIATDWLKPNSGQTVAMKGAALKLLARHGGKAATPTILSVAQNEQDPKLKQRAISLLGSSNDDSVIGPLRDFAVNSPSNEYAEAALYALSQHSSPLALNALADFALSNKPVSLRRTAIRSIASRPGEPAVDALFRIYDSSQELDIRKSVISGFGNRKSERAGNKLVEIARNQSENIELRKAAISGIGRRGGENAVDILMSLYDSERNEEIKDAIMNSLGYLNDPRVTDKLIAIAKNPQTPIERRRRVVVLLSGSRSKDPKVVAFLEELLRQP